MWRSCNKKLYDKMVEDCGGVAYTLKSFREKSKDGYKRNERLHSLRTERERFRHKGKGCKSCSKDSKWRNLGNEF